MLMAKPVLVSNAKPLARVVRGCHCGFVFESGNAANAAHVIEAAYAGRLDNSIGERGRNRVLEQYTWHNASVALTGFYKQLEQDRGNFLHSPSPRPAETDHPAKAC
jgi:hypothetical protein